MSATPRQTPSRIATVHQAKGMQWPAVFVPCLRNNRFPSRALGRPEPDARDPARGDPRLRSLPRHFGGRDSAVLRRRDSRAEVPVRVLLAGRQQAVPEAVAVLRPLHPVDVGVDQRPRCTRGRCALEPRARHETPQVTLSFSELKYLFECPYQFKLRFLYGFNPPLHEALGYGKGLHDALAELHKRALAGE